MNVTTPLPTVTTLVAAAPAVTSPAPGIPAGAVPGDEFRLEIITDPDPDTPAAIVWFHADGIAAAIITARRHLAVHPEPDDAYGELYLRDGTTAVYLTTLHRGA